VTHGRFRRRRLPIGKRHVSGVAVVGGVGVGGAEVVRVAVTVTKPRLRMLRGSRKVEVADALLVMSPPSTLRVSLPLHRSWSRCRCRRGMVSLLLLPLRGTVVARSGVEGPLSQICVRGW
jgi:hypothetical protein